MAPVFKIPVLPKREVRGYPPAPGSKPLKPARMMTVAEMLTRDFDSDAHLVSYTCPQGFPYRLKKELVTPCTHTVAAANGNCFMCSTAPHPVMVLATFETDLVAKERPDLWYQNFLEGYNNEDGAHVSTRESIARLQAAHPGAFFWTTRKGFRLTSQLPKPFPILTPADADYWTAYYKACLVHLEATSGIRFDSSCCDWTRFMAVPRGVRNDGTEEEPRLVKQSPWTLGDPNAIGIWAPDLPEIVVVASSGITRGADVDFDDSDSIAPEDLQTKIPPDVYQRLQDPEFWRRDKVGRDSTAMDNAYRRAACDLLRADIKPKAAAAILSDPRYAIEEQARGKGGGAEREAKRAVEWAAPVVEEENKPPLIFGTTPLGLPAPGMSPALPALPAPPIPGSFEAQLAQAKIDVDTFLDGGTGNGQRRRLFTPGADFFAATDSPVKWRIKGLVQAGCKTIFYVALPKTGKSWHLIELCSAIATATPAFGEFEVPQPGKIAMFFAEDDGESVRSRFRALAKGTGRDMDTIAANSIMEPRGANIDVLKRDALYDIVAAVRMHFPEGIALLALDPLRDIHTGTENESDSMSTVAKHLKALGAVLDCGVLVTHHSPKGATGESVSGALRGSSALHGSSDGTIVLTEGSGRTDSKFPVKVQTELKSARGAGTFGLTLTVDDDANGIATCARWRFDRDVKVAKKIDKKAETALENHYRVAYAMKSEAAVPRDPMVPFGYATQEAIRKHASIAKEAVTKALGAGAGAHFQKVVKGNKSQGWKLTPAGEQFLDGDSRALCEQLRQLGAATEQALCAALEWPSWRVELALADLPEVEDRAAQDGAASEYFLAR